MKKYLNKALQFQWFYQTKPALIAMLLMFSGFAYSSMRTAFSEFKYNFARFEGNIVQFSVESIGLTLAIALMVIYFFSKGIDKRNKMYFITSGPFNKKQMLINEVLSLFAILLTFIGICLYIGICIYIDERELIAFSAYYVPNLLMLCFRLFLIGLIVIVFMELFDVLFSSSIAGFIGLFALPIVAYLNLIFTMSYVGMFINYNYYIFGFINNVNNIINSTINALIGNSLPYYEGIYNAELEVIRFFIGLAIIILAIVVGAFVLVKLYKKVKLEEIGKIFTFKWVERISVYLICYCGFIAIANVVLANNMVRGTSILLEVAISLIAGGFVFIFAKRICNYILGMIR